MSDVPVQLIVAAYQDEKAAKAALKELKRAKKAGHEVAYTVLASQEGIAVGRVAGGEDEVEAQVLTVDDEGLYSGQFVATADGYAVQQLVTDGEVVVEETVLAATDRDESGDTREA